VVYDQIAVDTFEPRLDMAVGRRAAKYAQHGFSTQLVGDVGTKPPGVPLGDGFAVVEKRLSFEGGHASPPVRINVSLPETFPPDPEK